MKSWLAQGTSGDPSTRDNFSPYKLGLKVTDDGRDEVGHLQRELVPVPARCPVVSVDLSTSNHLNNKYYNLTLTAFCLSGKKNRSNRVD